MRLLIDEAWRQFDVNASEAFLVRPSMPILWFGDLGAYRASPMRVVTVGLNPSGVEFPDTEPFQRFPAATRTNYAAALNDYFRVAPYRRWFDSYEPIRKGMGVSYYGQPGGTALHTDLCSPLATAPTWSGLTDGARARLIAPGRDLWLRLVDELAPHVVLLSIGSSYLAAIDAMAVSPWRSIHRVVREAPYETEATHIVLRSGRSVLAVRGRASQTPFGSVSKSDKLAIGQAAAKLAAPEVPPPKSPGQDFSIVQFMHPGGEHRPDDANTKHWNTGDHKRKFLVNQGSYLDGGARKAGEVEFWGEWEPQSRVEAKIDKPGRHGPSQVYRPYYVVPPTFAGQALQNTDPFVFGGPFRYSICRQIGSSGPSGLQRLVPGSLILFGSNKSGRFVLDTVFVVRASRPHDRDTFEAELGDSVPQAYLDTALRPWYADPKTLQSPYDAARMYTAATPDDPIEGMFSFFPCRPHDCRDPGFERPEISIPTVITDTLPMGSSTSRVASLAEVARVWIDVVAQVRHRGLMLGVEAEMPPRGAPSAPSVTLTPTIKPVAKVGKDHTKYDVTSGGGPPARLNKRRAVLAVVQALCARGVTPLQIEQASGDTRKLFQPVPSTLPMERYFDGPDDLITSGETTYALTNQWGASTGLTIERLLEAFRYPDVSCVAVS
jgi:hypothetical protein